MAHRRHTGSGLGKYSKTRSSDALDHMAGVVPSCGLAERSVARGGWWKPSMSDGVVAIQGVGPSPRSRQARAAKKAKQPKQPKPRKRLRALMEPRITPAANPELLDRTFADDDLPF